MYTRINVEFNTDDDLKLRGWFYKPNDDSPSPCIIMTHGFSALKEHYLDKFATMFTKAGMSVLVYDNRNFGDSDGKIRLEVDPVAQIRDMRNAITYVQKLEGVDPKKIGLWGTSFSGGTVLVTAAVDRRVKCLVSQVPFVSGHHKSLRLVRPEQWDLVRKQYEEDRVERLNGNPPKLLHVVPETTDDKSIMKIPSALSFFTSVNSWNNNVTLRSVENSGEFEPIAYIKYISPTPALFIIAKNDTVNTTDLALKAYKKARDPKKLVMIEGDHFSPYVDQFDICSESACKWFNKHLPKNLDKSIYLERSSEPKREIKLT